MLSQMVKRAMRPNQMEFDSAVAQMVNLLLTPRSVYRASGLRFRTKNYWHRDDPAFAVLQVFFMIVACIAFTIAFPMSWMGRIKFVLWEVVINWFLCGQILCTLSWAMSNRFMLKIEQGSKRREVEYMYAWDVHCNAFFPMFILLYVVQYLALPLLLADGFVPRLLSNGLFAFGGITYYALTFQGYLELPFVRHPERFLYPCILIAAGFILSMIFSVHASRLVVTYYFPKLAM